MAHRELDEARVARDAAFNEFVEESAKATRHSVKARAARQRYMEAADEVRAMEREVLSFGVNH